MSTRAQTTIVENKNHRLTGDSMSTCRLCDSPLTQTWTSRDAKSSETLTMALCGSCGLVQQAQLPSDDELTIYYSHHYREDYKSTHQPKLKYVYRAGLTAIDRLAFLSRAGLQAADKRLLDIGAGGGEFCYMARQAGFDARGIEPHQGYSGFARDAYGIDIQTCGIADVANRNADVVTLFHVFEHLAHPVSVIRKVWDILSPGGHLVIEVPNIHQADASPHNIYFKAHLFYYSRYSLLTAASVGFDVVRIEDDGNLMVVFKRRDTLADTMQLPTEADVAVTRQRLQEKGWFEYLFEGGGLKKPVSRLRRVVRESRISSPGPRQLLDALWATRSVSN